MKMVKSKLYIICPAILFIPIIIQVIPTTSAIRITKLQKTIVDSESSPFDPSLKTQYAKLGSNYKLKCKININALTFWTIDNEVPEEPKYKFLPDLNLLIRNVTQEDFEREYFCHAIQKGKMTVDSIQIELKPWREMKSLDSDSSSSQSVGQRSKIIYAIVGELKTLTCSVNARPYPEFKWLHRNGTLIQNKTDIIISSQEDVSNLTIFIRNSEYYGEFLCEAWNNLGRTEQTFVIQMPEKPTDIPFIFPKSLGINKITLGVNFDKSKNYSVQVQYKNTAEMNWMEESIGSFDESITLMNLKPNTTYLIRGAVKSQFILGDYSEPFQVTTDKLPVSSTTRPQYGAGESNSRGGQGRKLNMFQVPSVVRDEDSESKVINSTVWTSTKFVKHGTKMLITRTTIEEMDEMNDLELE